MGLDMYLTKKTYVLNWNHTKPENRHSIIVLKGGNLTGIKSERVQYIEELVAQWRKANAIHRWFVENVQDGKDECQESYVSTEQLQTLLTTVESVLNAIKVTDGDAHNGTAWDQNGRTEEYEPGRIITNPEVAHTLLPTKSGFFFGGTDYDEFYIQDLEYTRDTIKSILAEEDSEYYYRASW